MRIDPLELLVPKGYKIRQKILDTMFAIAKANRLSTCHLDELTQRLGKDEGEIHMVILYLVRTGYVKHVGSDFEHLYAFEPKGQSASIDKEFWRTGRNEQYKTLGLYALIASSIAGAITLGHSLVSNPSEDEIPQTEETTNQQHQPAEKNHQRSPVAITSDSVSLVTDSAMLRTAVYETNNP